MMQGEKVLWEESRRGESQTNGLGENAVGLVKRQAESMMSGLSQRMGKTLDTSSPWVYWLVRHAAALINRFQVGSDGKTRYERMRGKKYLGDIAEFGETVMWKRNVRGSATWTDRWGEGAFLGIREESGELLIGNREGVRRIGTIQRLGD